MNNLNNNNQMVNEVKRESEIAVEAVNYRTKNIQNFGLPLSDYMIEMMKLNL
jgi:predicted transcriptional regulator